MTKQQKLASNPMVNKAKKKAKYLQSHLKKHVPAIALNECLEIYAKLEGYTSWNNMKDALDKVYNDYRNGKDLVDLAVKVLEDQEEAYRWLTSPQFALGGKKPVSIWGTKQGHKVIKDVLMRIEYGVY